MYPQYGDARYVPEFGAAQGQLAMDPSASPVRYGYSPYFMAKDGRFSGMNMAPGMVQSYGGKPGAMVGHEGMYGQPGWNLAAVQGQPFMTHPGAKKPDYPFPGQVRKAKRKSVRTRWRNVCMTAFVLAVVVAIVSRELEGF